jgi:hypothetical protein
MIYPECAGNTGLNIIFCWIGAGLINIFGSNIFLGLLVIGFFLGFLMIQGARLDMKMAIIIPGFILASIFLDSWMLSLFLLGISVLVYFALSRFWNR